MNETQVHPERQWAEAFARYDIIEENAFRLSELSLHVDQLNDGRWVAGVVLRQDEIHNPVVQSVETLVSVQADTKAEVLEKAQGSYWILMRELIRL